MDRRGFLASTGVGLLVPLCGCGMASSPENPRLSLAGSDTIAGRHRLAVDVTVVEPLVTAEHPARIRIRTTNRGPERQFGRMRGGYLFAPFDNYVSQPSGLVIYLESMRDASDGPDDGDGRWSIWPANDGGAGLASFRFPAGETVENEYRVLDDASATGYYPTGEFRFARTFSIVSDDAEDREDVQWGFSLRVDPDE